MKLPDNVLKGLHVFTKKLNAVLIASSITFSGTLSGMPLNLQAQDINNASIQYYNQNSTILNKFAGKLFSQSDNYDKFKADILKQINEKEQIKQLNNKQENDTKEMLLLRKRLLSEEKQYLEELFTYSCLGFGYI